MMNSFKLPSYVHPKNGKLIASERAVRSFILDWVVDQNIKLAFGRRSITLYRLDRVNVEILEHQFNTRRLAYIDYLQCCPIIDTVGCSHHRPWTILNKRFEVVKQMYPGLQTLEQFFTELNDMNNHYSTRPGREPFFPSNRFDQYGILRL